MFIQFPNLYIFLFYSIINGENKHNEASDVQNCELSGHHRARSVNLLKRSFVNTFIYSY